MVGLRARAPGGTGSTPLAVVNARRPEMSWPPECGVVPLFGSRFGLAAGLGQVHGFSPPQGS